ncbi:MAG TPA: hypothetical protein VFG54_03710 [Prolixibacteraceae bacterium]|nr:hypothetical protein [Prolixibacteraceae bacterium]
MKHLFVVLLLSFMLNVAIAQEKVEPSSSQSQTSGADSSQSLNQADSVRMIHYELQKLKYESAYVRHCLRKYHQEKTNGYFLSFFGGVLMGASTGLTTHYRDYDGSRTTGFTTEGKALFLGGAVMSLVGTVMIIDSEKWFKRAYLGPDGLGIKINF